MVDLISNLPNWVAIAIVLTIAVIIGGCILLLGLMLIRRYVLKYVGKLKKAMILLGYELHYTNVLIFSGKGKTEIVNNSHKEMRWVTMNQHNWTKES